MSSPLRVGHFFSHIAPIAATSDGTACRRKGVLLHERWMFHQPDDISS